ncbi:MAG: DUF3863 domain-containing protein [Thermoguttaceae bacterium]|nr:DUF3863 domain-containing protein [Thermoguttaceae bacterium]
MFRKLLRVFLSALFLPFAVGVFAQQADVPQFDSGWSVLGKRVVTINAIVRVNQIEVARDKNAGEDESDLHNAETARRFRKAVSDGMPGAKVTWAFSWLALQDPRPNYVELREQIVEFHRLYGDEITFIPGAYFGPIYNSREQLNRDIHDGLNLVCEMVGDGYRPHAVVAGFLAADNLRFLAEEENIHVAQGTIWSQYGIDNGDGDGSICYPYYPSKEHACKPAQGNSDFIDCVNLDGWTCDFVCARRFGFEEGGNSRLGVGPIETYRNMGAERGLAESLAITATHFDDHINDNGFGWVTVAWELSLVTGCEEYVTDCLTLWLREIHRRWPDAIVPLLGEFGEAWRRDFPDNSLLNYHFVQRGTGIEGAHSEPNTEIEWFMNQKFRLALLRDTDKDAEPMVIDFTRYDIPAAEPADPAPDAPVRNWSLVNRINQKRRRSEDQPIRIGELTDEERALIEAVIPSINQTPSRNETAQ